MQTEKNLIMRRFNSQKKEPGDRTEHLQQEEKQATLESCQAGHTR